MRLPVSGSAFPLVSGLCLSLVISVATCGAADPPRYQWEPEQRFSYDMKIVVDAGDETITYQGIVHYTVKQADESQAIVTYRGGLRESKQLKQRAGRFGPFGPRGFGPSFPSPFTRPAFAGKTQTTNRITLTSRGQTLAMEGDSQLPYLLGNVSLLPFELLPENPQLNWTSDGGVAITEEENDRGPFGRFGPLSPFADRNVNKSVQSAGEVTTYLIQTQTPDKVVVEKSYRLHTPPTAGKASFEMLGDGTWTFDPKQNVPASSKMTLSLKVTKDNTSTTIPISLQYELLSQEKVAAIEAEAKQRAEQMAQAAAEKKAKAETPLSPEETIAAIDALRTGDSKEILNMLKLLADKSLREPDPNIAAAIEPHLSSTDRRRSSAAEKAMAKWSPNFATLKKLEKEYQGPSPLDSTELVVESTTPLFVGQILQAQHPRRGSFWRAAKVKTLLQDGRVEIAFLTWGKPRDVATVTRRYLQLAPPELDQPERPAAVPSPIEPADPNAARTWTDASGRFEILGVFLNLTDGQVNLRRDDGLTVTIPLDKLSPDDRALIDQLQQAENPFKVK